jgi:hypothetical protein
VVYLGTGRTHLKNIFWPNIFVGASLQILDIQQYASGIKLGPASILNQNPIFEMGSILILALKMENRSIDTTDLMLQPD